MPANQPRKFGRHQNGLDNELLEVAARAGNANRDSHVTSRNIREMEATPPTHPGALDVRRVLNGASAAKTPHGSKTISFKQILHRSFANDLEVRVGIG